MESSDPIDMSQVGLGNRYGSQDMSADVPELRPGKKFSVEKDGMIYTDTIESVHYSSASPVVYHSPNRWQRMIRRFTPQRWRKSPLISSGEAATVTINSDHVPTEKTMQQLEQMKGLFGRIINQ